MSHHPTPVGELRPSQLLWSFGIGAVVDLPALSAIVLGLEDWDAIRGVPIGEERLLAAVRTRLGSQVERLLGPPPAPDDGRTDPLSPEAKIGVPVATFPRWLRCPICHLLAPVETGLFQLKENPYRPDLTRYVHSNCQKSKRPPPAVPARFTVACAAGHLDDFPWVWYVHGGSSTCPGPLEFYERGASLETANLMVKCRGCDAPAKPMINAFGEQASDHLPTCRAYHPHLRRNDGECEERLRTVLLGASNAWFADTFTVVSIPTKEGILQRLVDEHWHVLREAKSPDWIDGRIDQPGLKASFKDYTPEDIWKVVEERRAAASSEALETEVELDLKGPEWEVFSKPDASLNGRDFRLAPTTLPSDWDERIVDVLLVERLREVNGLIGFTRIQPPGEALLGTGRRARAPLSNDAPSWIPATEVRGEGIFLRFDLDLLTDWLALPAVRAREKVLRRAHTEWRSKRQLDPPDDGFPGALYVALHSLSHALMRDVALECGYGAASIRERVYARVEDDEATRAGILIYTAAPDSEGTLGGLVRLGHPEELKRILDRALERSTLCSSDPLCSEHDPRRDATLHGACCHSCLFAPETSCESGNRYLDRALVVPTFESAETALFPKVGES